MKLAIIESPFAGNVDRNIIYARRAVRHALENGYAPIASHLLYTQPNILNDDISEERQWGINAGLAWITVANYTLVYEDYGISGGMEYGIEQAEKYGSIISFISIGEN